jgi:alpha-glucosidase
MERSFLALLITLASAASIAEPLELKSPDGNVRFQLSTNSERQLFYSLTVGGKLRIEPSRLGVIVDNLDLGTEVTLSDVFARRAGIPGGGESPQTGEVFPWRGNKSTATNLCAAYEVHLRTGVNVAWKLEVRVFNDGVGFRFRVPGEGIRRIQGESTTWQFPKAAKVWFQTSGGAGAYEGIYQSSRADQIPPDEQVQNTKRPVHLGPPVTVEFPDGGFGLISEAALYNYSGMSVKPEGDAKLRAVFPDDRNGWSQDGEILSPWRVVVLSRDLDGLVNSDLVPALCEPPDPKLFPQGMDTAWLKPGKAPCTWMVYGNDGAQWHRQKWFVDLAAATGCEYLLVDAGWRSERWGWLKDGGDLWGRAAELCRYAAERNVGIVLWHAYPEGRDDSPGLTTVEAREELFRNCQKAGVKGVKIDFFNSESKVTIEAYEDLLRRAAKYQLLVNFHGAHKPTGEPRTWPNEITREGIREQEYVLWDSLPLAHYGALPFTRMAVGHADFLPGYVQRRFLKNTTPIFQMASVIVFSSPFLCWPDNPEAYLNSPLLQFVRTVPVTWDETRVLPGSIIGDTVIMARRKGGEWYVAVLNCRAEARALELDLSLLSLEGKEMTLYRDGSEGAACQIEGNVKPPAHGRLPISLRAGGGFIAHLGAPKTFTGWK